MYVIPTPGAKIFDPDRRDYLPAAGRLVDESAYWWGLIRDGQTGIGVVEGVAPVPATPAPDNAAIEAELGPVIPGAEAPAPKPE